MTTSTTTTTTMIMMMVGGRSYMIWGGRGVEGGGLIYLSFVFFPLSCSLLQEDTLLMTLLVDAAAVAVAAIITN
jgi:hypothetical protein